MKATNSLIALVLLIFSGLAFGQTEVDRKLLLGSWTLDHTASLASMKHSAKLDWEAMPKERKDRITQSYRNRSLVIGANDQYALFLSNGKQALGTWKYDKEDSRIVITHSNGKVTRQKIKFVDGTRLVLVPKLNRQRTLLIPELHYTRN